MEILATYLNECIVPNLGEPTTAHKTPRKTVKKRRRRGTYRARVLRALNSEWQSVDELKLKTGIDAEKIRGVLYAPNRDALGIETRRTERSAEFRKVG